MLNEHVTVSGDDGLSHSLTLYGFGEALPNAPGVYFVLAKSNVELGRYAPIYVGQAENIANRHASHEKGLSFALSGATHIGVLFEQNAFLRFSIEAALRRQYDPPLNKQ